MSKHPMNSFNKYCNNVYKYHKHHTRNSVDFVFSLSFFKYKIKIAVHIKFVITCHAFNDEYVFFLNNTY